MDSLLNDRMSPKAAVDWMMEHEDDEDIDKPLSSEQIQRIKKKKSHFKPSPDVFFFFCS